jgi:hypothetical protein
MDLMVGCRVIAGCTVCTAPGIARRLGGALGDNTMVVPAEAVATRLPVTDTRCAVAGGSLHRRCRLFRHHWTGRRRAATGAPGEPGGAAALSRNRGAAAPSPVSAETGATMADTATTEARLAEAEAALHRLLTGSQLELRHSAGAVSRSAATAANIGELRGYIAQPKRDHLGRRARGSRFAGRDGSRSALDASGSRCGGRIARARAADRPPQGGAYDAGSHQPGHGGLVSAAQRRQRGRREDRDRVVAHART